MIGYVDLVTTRASGAYLDAQQLLLADSDRVRRDLLEDLLDGGEPADRRRAGGGARGRARSPTRAACSSPRVPTNALEDAGALPRAADTLAAALRGRHAPLAVTRHGEIVLVQAQAAGERPALRGAADEGLRAGRQAGRHARRRREHRAATGSRRSAPPTARRRRRCAERAATGGGVLSLPDLSAFEYLTLRNDAAARRLIAPEIEAFVAEDREHGGHLIATLLAYADADLNAKAAAEALLIHPNTAHYRLGADRGEDRHATCAACRTSSTC